MNLRKSYGDRAPMSISTGNVGRSRRKRARGMKRRGKNEISRKANNKAKD